MQRAERAVIEAWLRAILEDDDEHPYMVDMAKRTYDYIQTIHEPHRQISSLGGKKSAANLTPEQRRERARQAAKKRWNKN